MTVSLCVLLWAADGERDALVAYEDSVLRLIPRHGGVVRSRVRVREAGDGPYEVQLIDLPDEGALASYMEDPERLALAEVHRRVISRTDVMRVETVV